MEMISMGELPALIPPEKGTSIVTAVSARDRKNLPRLVERLDSALRFAEEQSESSHLGEHEEQFTHAPSVHDRLA